MLKERKFFGIPENWCSLRISFYNTEPQFRVYARKITSVLYPLPYIIF